MADQEDRKPSPEPKTQVQETIRHPLEDDFSGTIKPGDVLSGKYEIIGLIGRGGMGSVFEARECDFEIPRTVALKVLSPELLRNSSRNSPPYRLV